MTILGLIFFLVVIGLVMWLVNTYIPMAQPVKTILNVVVVILIVLWLISSLGVLGPLNTPIRIR